MIKVINVEDKEVSGNINYNIIIDRSGSMAWTIEDLCETVIKLIDSMQESDMVSIGWFSSQGQYGYLVKNHVIGPNSKDQLTKVIRAHNTSIALTCFSQILRESKTTLETAQSMGGYTDALIFMTDGHPVVRDVNKERIAIFKALGELNFDLSMFIGYGSYYNKPLMAEMADAVGGTLIHANNIKEYESASDLFIQAATPVVEMNVDALGFYIKGKTVTKLSTPVAKIPVSVSEIYMVEEGVLDDSPIEALYALAYLYVQRINVQKAMHVLNTIGDVAIMDKLNAAFTTNDIAIVEKMILDAMTMKGRRFLDGKDTNHIPRRDAPCVWMALELLKDDKEAEIYLGFDYKRTGVKQKDRKGFPKFKRTVEKAPLGLVFHSSRPNINMRLKIDGEVKLNPVEMDGKATKPGDVGLSVVFKTHQFRIYTIVKDGVLNLVTFEVSSSYLTFLVLDKMGMVKEGDETRYTVSFEGFPIMNQHLAELGIIPLDSLVDILEDELDTKAKQTALNFFIKKLDPDKTKRALPFTEEQQRFLKLNGIYGTTYSPPSDSLPPVDYYIANQFNIYKIGFKSIPSAPKTFKKIEDGKDLTPREQLIAPHLEQYKTATLNELNEALEQTKDDLQLRRSEIQMTKLAVIVGNQWWPETSEREFEYKGWRFEFTQTEVYY